MTFEFTIPSHSGQFPIRIDVGSSAIFVGANGGGKTRLAVFIETALGGKAHRISAHRSLVLNPKVIKISEEDSLTGLRNGYVDGDLISRRVNRWNGKEAVFLLNDFDFVMQALFADQNNIALLTHKNLHDTGDRTLRFTKFQRLEKIWSRLLPHRVLEISGDNIQVSIQGESTIYNAMEMSDGERAIFYLIGQVLVAAENSLLIIDEPELHVHRAIMSKLWDELESARPDCAFVFITHDLEFAASRVAQKFVLSDYDSAQLWAIESVPKNTGFSEDLTTLILGSRFPILFVEGTEGSLDAALYRCCFPEWTVVPRGSCQEVIHSVVTLRNNQNLTRAKCTGIVDGDGHLSDDIAYMESNGVFVLPVSEIENIILLPGVSRAIAESHGYQGEELDSILSNSLS